MKMDKKLFHISLVILVFLLFIKTKTVAIGYSASDYYSLHQRAMHYNYIDDSGVSIDQERTGYKEQNNLDAISRCSKLSCTLPAEGEIRAITTSNIKSFKVFVAPGSTRFDMDMNCEDNYSDFVFVARFGTPPEDHTAYINSLSSTERNNLPSSAFTLKQLRDGDCIGTNSVGYIFIASDGGLNFSSDGIGLSAKNAGWLYVNIYSFSSFHGSGKVVYGTFLDMVNTSSYLSWYNAYNGWSVNGDPSENGNYELTCASSTCTGNSCWDETSGKYIDGTKTEGCATVSPGFNPSSINLSAQSATTSKLSWSSTGANSMQIQCTGPKTINKTDTDTTYSNYPMEFDKVAKTATVGTETETCAFYPMNNDGQTNGTPSSANLNVITDETQLSKDGQCGSAAKSYSAKLTGWGDYNNKFCDQGTANPAQPIFPTQDNPTTWTCLKTNNGDDATCTATIRSNQSTDDCLKKATTKYVCCPDNPDCVDTTCKNSVCYDGCKYVPGDMECK